MSSITTRLKLNCPKWLPNSVQYEALMGSIAYGVSDDTSDKDIYGFCIPPKSFVFPHTTGEIEGFGPKGPRFDQFVSHHVEDTDLTIFSIVKYCHLCMNGNPNMIDSLFVPQNCVLHCTDVGTMIRESRRLFLSKKVWHTFKGYAFSQLHKMSIKQPQEGSKRELNVKAHGYDTKFAYHIVRLIDEVEEILSTGDLTLGRNREYLKAIRRGEVPEVDIRQRFTDQEKQLEELYHKSTLRYSPDVEAIRGLLMKCLEHHYGTIDTAVRASNAELILAKIRELV